MSWVISMDLKQYMKMMRFYNATLHFFVYIQILTKLSHNNSYFQYKHVYSIKLFAYSLKSGVHFLLSKWYDFSLYQI